MNPRNPLLLRSAFVLSLLFIMAPRSASSGETLKLNLRTRSNPNATPTLNQVSWAADKTAIVVCDMWDDHWCQSAARRVGELAPALNNLLNTAREQGALIIHAPSSVTGFYENVPQRKAAQAAPFSAAPIKLSIAERWGTNWCWPDPSFESVLPIDDSDMGCSCSPTKCEIRDAWTQIGRAHV